MPHTAATPARMAATSVLYVGAIFGAALTIGKDAAPSALSVGLALVPGIAILGMIWAIGKLAGRAGRRVSAPARGAQIRRRHRGNVVIGEHLGSARDVHQRARGCRYSMPFRCGAWGSAWARSITASPSATVGAAREQSPQGPARRAQLEPAGPRRPARGQPPERQRDRRPGVTIPRSRSAFRIADVFTMPIEGHLRSRLIRAPLCNPHLEGFYVMTISRTLIASLFLAACSASLASTASATEPGLAPSISAEPAKRIEVRMDHISIESIGSGPPVVLIPRPRQPARGVGRFSVRLGQDPPDPAGPGQRLRWRRARARTCSPGSSKASSPISIPTLPPTHSPVRR